MTSIKKRQRPIAVAVAAITTAVVAKLQATLTSILDLLVYGCTGMITIKDLPGRLTVLGTMISFWLGRLCKSPNPQSALLTI
jgi:hypothetical protein